MRIIVGGMNHESNTLNPIITDESDFVIFRGEEMLNKGMYSYYSSTGIIQTLREEGCEIVPTILARAVPNGVVSKTLYHKIKDEFLARVWEALASGPVDGVCLALHGSMKVEGLGCAEGDLLSDLRKLVPQVPITAALDMHASITDKMIRHVNAFVGYKTAPHVDCAETGAHAARMLLEALTKGTVFKTAWIRIPMLVAGEKSETAMEPMASLIELCRDAEKEPAIVAASYLLGFPWADEAHNTVSVLVTARGDQTAAELKARDLAETFWRRRGEFVFRAENYDSRSSLDAAYLAVLKDGTRPVFISDSGDNPTAGATGDSTDMLDQVIQTMDTADKLPTPLLYSGFFALDAVHRCLLVGEGASVEIQVGGIWDRVNGKPHNLRVTVTRIVRSYGPYHADVVLVRYRNLDLVLTSKHIGFGDEDLLPALGVDAETYCLVIVKLGYLEPCFRTIAQRSIMATSKGCSNEVLESIPYKNVKRPVYPLDPEITYSPQISI